LIRHEIGKSDISIALDSNSTKLHRDAGSNTQLPCNGQISPEVSGGDPVPTDIEDRNTSTGLAIAVIAAHSLSTVSDCERSNLECSNAADDIPHSATSYRDKPEKARTKEILQPNAGQDLTQQNGCKIIRDHSLRPQCNLCGKFLASDAYLTRHMAAGKSTLLFFLFIGNGI
jgi:hypothetical protein